VPTEVPTETPVPEPTETVPALPVRDGFEGELTGWVVEGAAIVPGASADGSAALHIVGQGSVEVPGTPGYALRGLTEPQRELYLSLDVRVDGQDETPFRIGSLYGAEGEDLVAVFRDPSGALGVHYAETGETRGLVELPLGVWATVELHVVVAEGQLGVELWVDGVFVRRDVVATSVSEGVGIAQLGQRSTDRTFAMTVDNVALDRACTRVCGSEPSQPAPEPPVEPSATSVPPSDEAGTTSADETVSSSESDGDATDATDASVGVAGGEPTAVPEDDAGA
jgi:hypothetical protein